MMRDVAALHKNKRDRPKIFWVREFTHGVSQGWFCLPVFKGTRKGGMEEA